MEGILNLDKPTGISSARAVARVKRMLPRGTKVGHAGTLDPFATGVLLVLVGTATKRCESLMDEPKQYETILKLGATTETDDWESPERITLGTSPPFIEDVSWQLQRFIGVIQQRPPAYSAMKIGGRRAYALARQGHSVALPARNVHVYGIELLKYHWPTLSLRIDCGRGTYIRAFARDLGEALGVGGYLTALRRTRIGSFRDVDAIALDQLTPVIIADHLTAS